MMIFFTQLYLFYGPTGTGKSRICLFEPHVTHEASGVPIGSKNEFDLKDYINDL